MLGVHTILRVPKHYVCSVSGLGCVQEYFPTFRRLLVCLSSGQTNLGVTWELKRRSASGPCEAGRRSDRPLYLPIYPSINSSVSLCPATLRKASFAAARRQASLQNKFKPAFPIIMLCSEKLIQFPRKPVK